MAVYFKPTSSRQNEIEEIKKQNDKLKQDLASAQAINRTNMMGIMELANRLRDLEEKQ